MGVCEITTTEIYRNGLANPGGLSDPRMGVCDSRQRCATCEGSINDCPGHFGYIRLAKPVYHIGFLDIVKKILSSVCCECSRLLMHHVNPNINPGLSLS